MGPFNERGSFWSFDGEIFVQKGLGRARILYGPEKLAIDLFTTHLVSYTNNPNYDNNRIRYIQTLETVRLIERTDADVKIFAGDVNALPFPGLINGKRQPYSLLTSIMTDSLVDRYPDASWHPWFATFGNHHNTYSASDAPERIDYLMYWAAPHIAMCTRNFTMPMYTTINRKGNVVSLSDHEALDAEFLIERRSTPYDWNSPAFLLDKNDNLDHRKSSSPSSKVPKSSSKKLNSNPNPQRNISDFIRYSQRLSYIKNSNAEDSSTRNNYENSSDQHRRT